MPGKTKTIGIRLTVQVEEVLRQEAAKHKMAPSTYAQKLVTDGLTRTASVVEEKLAELQASIDRLERELPAKVRAASATEQRGSPGPASSEAERPTPFREWVTQSGGDD